MGASYFDTQFSKALKAGQRRDYRKAIGILEDLAARGAGDSPRGGADGPGTGTGPGEGTGEGAAGNGSLRGHPEVYLYLARSWHAEKRYDRAASCARSYVRRRPDDGSGWFFLGRSFLAGGSYDRAAHALRKSIEINPDSTDARALLGMAYLKGRKPAHARATFEAALTLAPDDSRLNQGYLNALFVEAVRVYRKGDADTARQMLTFLINNDIDGVVPRLYLAHALRDLDYLPEALSQYEAAIEFEPDDEALRWYPVSILIAMGETSRAAELMAELGEAPAGGELSDQVVKLRIIRSHLDQQEWANAAEAARSWIRDYGSVAQVHALLGEAFRNLGKSELAAGNFNRAIELDRENPAPHYGLLMLYASARDWKALDSEVSRAARAGCDAATVGYYRVLCGANLDADPERLLPAIQEQVREHGSAPELMAALARTYFRLGLADLAIGWYRKVAELEPDNEEASLGYLTSCEELERIGEAKSRDALEKAYRAYLGRWGDNAAIRADFVRYLVSREEWAEAADEAERLSALGNAPIGERHVAFYRRKAGQYRQAAILYRNMLRKKPDDQVMLANLVFCLDRMGETGSALALMREANRAFKPTAAALLIEGRLAARSGNADAALASFRRVVDLFPKDARGWEEISEIYRRQGVAEMAALYAQKARDCKKR